MAQIGFSDRFLVNGYELSGYVMSFTGESEMEEKDFQVLNNTGVQYIAGSESASLELEGIFDSDTTNADRIHDVLSAAFRSRDNHVLSRGVGAFAVGSVCEMMDGPQINYRRPIESGELLKVEASFRSNNGDNHGHFLVSSALAAGTHNGTAVDNAAGTTNGGLFHVHLHNDDASDVDVKVQHSTDNSIWADLTGAVVSDLSAEHTAGSATVAAGTTVNRYIRSVATVTGGDTVLLTAAFARRY
jgi:hypothetical protein